MPNSQLLLIISTAAAVAVSSAPSPFLPPLLRFNNGSVVDTAEQWIGGRRGEVAALVQEVITGSIPSGSIPPLIRSRTINTTRLVGGNSTFVELTPICTETCLRGCYAYALSGATHAPLPLALLPATRRAACEARRGACRAAQTCPAKRRQQW